MSVTEETDYGEQYEGKYVQKPVWIYYAVIGGWIVGPKWISDEMESSGHPFKRKKLYNIMIKYIAPVLMLILALQSIGILDVLLGQRGWENKTAGQHERLHE